MKIFFHLFEIGQRSLTLFLYRSLRVEVWIVSSILEGWLIRNCRRNNLLVICVRWVQVGYLMDGKRFMNNLLRVDLLFIIVTCYKFLKTITPNISTKHFARFDASSKYLILFTHVKYFVFSNQVCKIYDFFLCSILYKVVSKWIQNLKSFRNT